MLTLKLFSGFFALLLAVLSICSDRGILGGKVRTTVLVLLTVVTCGFYMLVDYKEEQNRRSSEQDFRAATTEISKDILRVAHPYHPKEVRFDYCFPRDILESSLSQYWDLSSSSELYQKLEKDRIQVYKSTIGSVVDVVFSRSSEFGTPNPRSLVNDIATLHLEPHQVSEIILFGGIAKENLKKENRYCQHIVFNVPEIGFNAFDSLNAVKATSYYDLSGSYFLLYANMRNRQNRFSLPPPEIENLSIAFGNGIRKFYLSDEQSYRSVSAVNVMAYVQPSGIPAIEVDYPNLANRFQTNFN